MEVATRPFSRRNLVARKLRDPAAHCTRSVPARGRSRQRSLSSEMGIQREPAIRTFSRSAASLTSSTGAPPSMRLRALSTSTSRATGAATVKNYEWPWRSGRFGEAPAWMIAGQAAISGSRGRGQIPPPDHVREPEKRVRARPLLQRVSGVDLARPSPYNSAHARRLAEAGRPYSGFTKLTRGGTWQVRAQAGLIL